MKSSFAFYLLIDSYILYGILLMNYLICNDVSIDFHGFSRFENNKCLYFSLLVFLYLFLLIQLLALYLQTVDK